MIQLRYWAWLGCVVGLFLFGIGQAFAQAVPATDPIPRVAFPMTHVGNISTVGPRTADAANAAKFSFGVASNGAVFANTTDRLPTPGGASIPIGVNGTISKPSVAAALGRFARKALPLVSTGFALYDLGQELGFGMENSGGALQITKTQTTWGWRAGTAGHVYKPSIGEACNQVLSFFTGGYLLYEISSTQDRVVCTAPENPAGSQYTFNKINQGTTTSPQTVEQFVDAVSAKSTWPTSSALARATVDALRSGESLQVEPTTVTGPATSPGGSSQTVNETLGETTTSTATHHHTYAGPQITTTTVTNNVTTNNSTGAVTSTSTTTTQPVINPSPAANETPFVMPCGIPGAPPCAVKVDETGTPSYDPEKIKLDPTLETKAQELRDKVSGEGDKTGLFTNLRGLFTLPAIRECEPIEMPSVFGMQVPTMDPCPGVVWLRGLMAWIWAGIGFMWCWSQVQSARK